MGTTGAARRLQNWTFLVLILGAAYFCWRTIEPIWLPVFLGLLIAVSVNPLHQKLRRKLRKDGLSAALLTFAVMAISIGLLAFLAVVVGSRVVVFARDEAARYKNHGAAGLLPTGTLTLLARLGIDPATARQHIANAADTVAGGVGRGVTAVLGMTFSGVFVLIFTALTSYYLLVEGEKGTRWFVDVTPLPNSQVWELVRNFRDVTRAMLLGTLVTAFYQGFAAFLAYWVFGVPDAVVWGSLTGVASLLPGLGTLLVWVPLAAWLMTESLAKGLGLLALCSVGIVIVADYVLRPWLVKAKLRMNDLLVFIAIFGGIEAFGLVGLILGPIFIALFVSLLRIYQREYRPRAEGQAERPALVRPSVEAADDRRQEPRPAEGPGLSLTTRVD